MGEGTVFSLSVHSSTGGGEGTRSSLGWGGVPDPALDGGGYLVSGPGDTWSQVWGGVPGLRPGGWGVPVKGKIFDTRFGLIHVQTGKKIFTEGPPPSKGKIF